MKESHIYFSSEIEVAFFCYAFSGQICLSRVKSPKVPQSYGDLSSQSRPINCGKDCKEIQHSILLASSCFGEYRPISIFEGQIHFVKSSSLTEFCRYCIIEREPPHLSHFCIERFVAIKNICWCSSYICLKISVGAVRILFLLKLKWPKSKSFYGSLYVNQLFCQAFLEIPCFTTLSGMLIHVLCFYFSLYHSSVYFCNPPSQTHY